MQQANLTSLTIGANNFFSGYVQDNNIYTYSGELIGVNLAKYQAIEEGLVKCKNKLIELGEIEIPKTQEEIIKEQTQMLKKQNDMLTDMMNRYQELQQQIGVLTHEYKHSQELNKLSTAEYKEQGEQCYNQSSGDDRSVTDKNKTRCNKSDAKSKK